MSKNGFKDKSSAIRSDKTKKLSELDQKLGKYNITKKATIFTLTLSILVDFFGFSLFLPLIPTIAEEFGQGELLVGIIIASNAITSLFFGPMWGKLSDKYGRKPILIINQIGTIGAFIMLASSNTIPLIITARMVDGVFGGQFPIIQAIVADVTDVRTRSLDFSKIMVIGMLATLVGPVLGGVLGSIFGWRVPALITAGMGILSVILAVFVLIETMPKERRMDLKILRQTANGGMEKKLPLKELLTPPVRLRLLEGFIFAVIFQIFISTFTSTLHFRYNWGELQQGIFMSVFSITNAIFGGPVLHILVKKTNSTNIIKAGLMCLIASMFIYGFASDWWLIIIFMVLYQAGAAFVRPILRTNLTLLIDEDQQGRISGISNSLLSVSRSTIPILAGGILGFGVYSILSFNISAYWILGMFGMTICILLFLIVLYDKKKIGF